jgi:predicted PurR-regulated permease PerM
MHSSHFDKCEAASHGLFAAFLAARSTPVQIAGKPPRTELETSCEQRNCSKLVLQRVFDAIGNIEEKMTTPAQMQTVHSKFDWSGLTIFLITLCALVVCAWILSPFLTAITGAVVLAVVTQRPHRWISAHLKKPTLAATTSLLLVGLSIVGPALYFALVAASHLLAAIQSVQSGAAEQAFRQFITQHQRIAAGIQYAMDNFDISQTIQNSSGFLAGRMASFLGGSVSALAQIGILLFILFFLYRDSSQLLSSLRFFMPLNKEEADYLLERIRTAINALVLGRFAVAAIQGFVAGITYACAGVSEPSLLGLVTMLFALIPAVGAFVIWLPIAIYLAVVHQWIQAIIVLVVGALIISTLDNFLYPILVGPKMQMHTVVIFLSMLGGVLLFGVIGLILGPITLAVTESLIFILRRRAMGGPLPGGSELL